MTIDHDDRCEALDEALTKLEEVHELLDAAGLLVHLFELRQCGGR